MHTLKLFGLASLVGILIGIVGSLFQLSITYIINSKAGWFTPYFTDEYLWIPYVVSSTSMLFFSIFLVKRFSPEAAGSGIQEIEGFLILKRSMHPLRVLLVKFFGGISALGGGMVLGREGPTIHMGGTVGHLVARLANLEADELRSLVASGAGAGLAVAFNAPLAGILFVLEEMRGKFKHSYLSFQSLAIATLSGVIVLHLIMGNVVDLSMKIFLKPEVMNLWIFGIFGIFLGIFGFIFNKSILLSLDFFASLKGFWKNIFISILGISVGLLLYAAPDNADGGFMMIYQMFSSSASIQFLLILILVRFIMSIASYSSGAPGGVFAPMLALGTLFGLLFGHLATELFSNLNISPLVFAVVGMGALFSATVRAPLTGVVLIVELTQNYTLVLPLLITSFIAISVVQAMGGKPLYSLLLNRTLQHEQTLHN